MIESDVLVVVDRVADGLRPDVAALVAGGRRRGRTRRRARRTTRLLAGAAAVSALAVGGFALVHPAPGGGPAGPSEARYRPPVGPARLSSALAALLPGATDPRDDHGASGSTAWRVGVVRYHGAYVTVTVSDLTYGTGVTGWPGGLPRADCERTRATCTKRGWDWTATYGDTGSTHRWASRTAERHTPDGYVVQVTATSRRDGTGLFVPVLDDERLDALAASPVWLG